MIGNITVGIRLIVFLFLNENICCGYSLEVPRRGASHEQYRFTWRIKKNEYFWIAKRMLSRAIIRVYLYFSYISMKTYVVGILIRSAFPRPFS